MFVFFLAASQFEVQLLTCAVKIIILEKEKENCTSHHLTHCTLIAQRQVKQQIHAVNVVERFTVLPSRLSNDHKQRLSKDWTGLHPSHSKCMVVVAHWTLRLHCLDERVED